MMMVVMMVAAMGLRRNGAMGRVASFSFCFRFHRHMVNVKMGKHMADLVFHLVGIPTDHRMERGVVVIAVPAPYMEVVHLDDTGDLLQTVAQLGNGNTLRRFFQKQPDAFPEIFGGMNENEYSHGNG